MNNFKKTFRGFTLVEVLIVIIIIGILIAALLPRLTGSQARARDNARAAMVNQIANGLSLFLADAAALSGGVICASTPTVFSGYVNGVATDLSAYMSTLPRDPQSNHNNASAGGTACNGSALVVIPTAATNSAFVYADFEGTNGANVPDTGGAIAFPSAASTVAEIQSFMAAGGTGGFAAFVRG